MEYLHSSTISSHGRLKSSNIVIDSHWICKITDYGMNTLLEGAKPNFEMTDHAFFSNLYWTAPELLRISYSFINGTKSGDVFAFGVIFKEVICSNEPYAEYEYMEPRGFSFDNEISSFISIFNQSILSILDIIEKVEKGPVEDGIIFRPKIDFTGAVDMAVLDIAHRCWQENPEERPTFKNLLGIIKKISKGCVIYCHT